MTDHAQTEGAGPRGIVTPNSARTVSTTLRRFADSVRPTEIIGYHDDVGTGPDLADLLELAASTIDALAHRLDEFARAARELELRRLAAEAALDDVRAPIEWDPAPLRALLPARMLEQLEAQLGEQHELVLDRTPILQPGGDIDQRGRG